MKYSHDYYKLGNPKYTTIRRYPKGITGDIVKEVYPSGEHFAKILMVEKRALDDVSLTELMSDTDCCNREEAYELFQSFYKKPIDFNKEKFFIYHLKRVNHA